MTWGLLLDSGVLIHAGMTRSTARMALQFHNDRRRAGVARGDMVTVRRAIGIAEVKQKPMLLPASTKQGRSKRNAALDDGPPIEKLAISDARARAWTTRRARYGEKGHA